MRTFFVFDVESIGLHGEGFAAAGGVYLENGSSLWEFKVACPPDAAAGNCDDRKWVLENVPIIEPSHKTPRLMRDEFWNQWLNAREQHATMATDCGWPVESKFLLQCVADDPERRNWEGPYPMVEISTYLTAAGMDPMKNYDRHPSELPKHDPLSDARQSARLLCSAIDKIRFASEGRI